jgi:GrpB-like predicted nucleotidyltransferase (UPF0157 family)
VTDWPVWATEEVAVHAPDAAWQVAGAREIRLLEVSLREWLVAPVEHVGSTAVPELPAKPILDLQAAVADLDCAPEVAAVLAPDGWHYVPPQLDEHPWRRFFVKVENDHRIAHLHLLLPDHPRWQQQLTFRDELRADPALAARYAELKRTLAARHSGDREAYTDGKADFVAAVLGDEPS